MGIKIKVPGSTSNIGAGFDSIGIALNVYLQLECVPHQDWKFIFQSEQLQGLSTGKDNLIYQAAVYTATRYHQKLEQPQCVFVSSDIPLTRGLGSSAAAIVAGVELANILLDLNLSNFEKGILACELEGHPDNVLPSLFGGCIIASYTKKQLSWIKIPISDLAFLALIPNYEMKTKDARAILPTDLSFRDSVAASSVANVSVAALATGNWRLLGELMGHDYFHQPYRKRFIPHYERIIEFMEKKGAYGTFLSGAGPTMLSMLQSEVSDSKIDEIKPLFPELSLKLLKVENEGCIKKSGELVVKNNS